MSERTVFMRTIGRFVLAGILVLGVVLVSYLLLSLLNDPNPNAALTALLGIGITALGTATNTLVGAIASNPSDRKPDSGDA